MFYTVLFLFVLHFPTLFYIILHCSYYARGSYTVYHCKNCAKLNKTVYCQSQHCSILSYSVWYLFCIRCTYFLKLVMMSFDKEIIHGDRDSKQYTRYILLCNVLPAKLVLSVSQYVQRGGCFFVREIWASLSMHENWNMITS